MSKGIKKLANIALHLLSAVVLVLFLFVLTVALAFSLPRVQTFAAHKAVDWLTEKFELNLSLERVSIAGLSNVVVEELYVEDLVGLNHTVDGEYLLSEMNKISNTQE